MSQDPDLVAAFAPTGVLRAVINLGNPVLANAGHDGVPGGVSVDLARAFAAQLGVECVLIPVDTAAQSVERIDHEEADIGFFAIDPLRGAKIAFTAPYVLIEGTYLVRDADAIHDSAQVDRPGHRIVVGQGSAYDLFLTRNIKHATLVRTARSEEVVDTFIADGIEVAAGVRQQLEADARRVPGLRILPGRFMTIRQAMGVAKSRGPVAAAHLARYLEERKAEGFVAAALARHGIEGASVAPAGEPD
jgi:polar amino acid transport system substrate-binding protein